jgi:hypothetical protein
MAESKISVQVQILSWLQLIMVFPIQRMSTIQSGIGIHHPQPRPRKTQEAVKIGTRRVSHHYQQYYCDAGVASVSWAELGSTPPKVRVLQSQQRVVPLRKELLELRIKDKFIWATYNTEDFSSSKKVISSGTRTVVSRVKLDTNSRNWK